MPPPSSSFGPCPVPITADELARALEPDVGKLAKLRLRATSANDPAGVEWGAVDEQGNVLAGKIELRAIVRQDQILSVAEAFVEERVDPVARRVADQSEVNVKTNTGIANAIMALAHGMHECIHCHVKAPKMSGFAARLDCSKF